MKYIIMGTPQKAWIKVALLAGCIYVGITGDVLGQTGHYWTNHFGLKASVLGNSVIGSVDDHGAVFYNPSRLTLNTIPNFSVNTKAIQYNQYTYDDPFGTQSRASSNQFAALPSLIAGTLSVGKTPQKHKIAISFLNRNRVDIDVDFGLDIEPELLDSVESASVGIQFRHQLIHHWYAISYAIPLSETISFGVTWSTVRMVYRKTNGLGVQGLRLDGDVDNYNYKGQFDFTKFGFLGVIGVSGIHKSLSWGVKITTPMLNLFGKGDYRYEEFLSVNEEGTEDQFATARESGLNVKYKSPVSIGLGAGWELGSFTLHQSIEWFLPIDTYTLMMGDERFAQSDGRPVDFRLVTQLRHVVNYGVGIEYALSNKTRLYWMFNTDFSAVDENPDSGFTENQFEETQLTAFTPNFYHYGFGVLTKIKQSAITIGISRSHGTQFFNTPIGVPPGDIDLDLPREQGDFKWNRWQIVFGVSVNFQKENEDI